MIQDESQGVVAYSVTLLRILAICYSVNMLRGKAQDI
jgi:hypothetical protein